MRDLVKLAPFEEGMREMKFLIHFYLKKPKRERECGCDEF
jgi:hypothetical protein